MGQQETDDFDYICTTTYANIMTKECVCKYVPEPGYVVTNIMGYVPDQNLVLNPEY